MLFNSYPFLLLFLPLTWLAFVAAGKMGGTRAAVGVLIMASLVFYGCWSLHYLLLLSVLLLINYGFGRLQERSWKIYGQGNRPSLIAILVVNVGTLGYFKYAHFF